MSEEATTIASQALAPKSEVDSKLAAPEDGFLVPNPEDEESDSDEEQQEEEVQFEKTLWPVGEGEGITFARDWCWKLWEAPDENLVSHYVNIYILVLIVTSSVVGVIETVPGLHKKDEVFWFILESIFVSSFTFEFVCRCWSCPDYKAFWTSGMNYIDVLSIIPYYFDLIMDGEGANLSVLRILRLGRAIRLVKLSRYSGGIQLIMAALERSLDALQLFFMLLILIVIVCASGIYFVERGTWVGSNSDGYYERTDPLTDTKEKSPFQSIPQSYWWCIVTLTTVGYGDYYPVTYMGKVMGTLAQLIGVVCLALPLSIIGSNFIEERQKIIDAEAAAALLAEKNGSAGEHGKDQGVKNIVNIAADNRTKCVPDAEVKTGKKNDDTNVRQPQMYAERFQKNVLEICGFNDKILGPASRCLALMHRQIIELDSGDVVKAAGPAVHDPHGRDTDELLVVPQVLDYFEDWLAEAEVQAELMAKYVGAPDQGLTHRVPSRVFKKGVRDTTRIETGSTSGGGANVTKSVDDHPYTAEELQEHKVAGDTGNKESH